MATDVELFMLMCMQGLFDSVRLIGIDLSETLVKTCYKRSNKQQYLAGEKQW
jgi:hypothetical protein